MNQQTNDTVQALPLTDNSRVIVAACPSYAAADVCSALREAMDALGGIASWVKPGQTVLLKPNLFTAHPPEHVVTTHPEVVRQVILLCAQAGAGKIWVGDSPVGTQDEKRLWSMTGMETAVKDTPAELKSWRVQQKTLACGEDQLAVPEWYSQVDVVISLPKLKAHCLTTLSCGLKNMYGMVSGPAKLQFHIKYPSPLTMSTFLVDVFSVLKPHLTIADGVMAMEGNGPAHGHPRPVGILLASRDTVALDAVGCRALRIAPSTVPMIRIAAEKGLGVMEAAQIDAVGSGLARLQAAYMKPSLSRLLRYIPEPLFKLSVLFWQMRPKILTRECIVCGKCVANCPKKTIIMNEKTGYPRVVQKQCIACFCCMESCPKGAIVLQIYLGSLFCVARQRRKGTT
jgi:uncharacterized protein (DUF362 family)/Pyruvate/2-oxoacid:ferredoxin oxidoreductase delta subunit